MFSQLGQGISKPNGIDESMKVPGGVLSNNKVNLLLVKETYHNGATPREEIMTQDIKEIFSKPLMQAVRPLAQV